MLESVKKAEDAYIDRLLNSAEARRQRQQRNMAMFTAIVWMMFFFGVMAFGVIVYKIALLISISIGL